MAVCLLFLVLNIEQGGVGNLFDRAQLGWGLVEKARRGRRLAMRIAACEGGDDDDDDGLLSTKQTGRQANAVCSVVAARSEKRYAECSGTQLLRLKSRNADQIHG